MFWSIYSAALPWFFFEQKWWKDKAQSRVHHIHDSFLTICDESNLLEQFWMTSQWRMKVSTSFRTLVMIPEMEVAGSGTRLVGSIGTPKPRQILYIQMIMIRIQNHIIKMINIPRTYYLIVSNKSWYIFIFSTNIYCQQGLRRISNQTSHPPQKKKQKRTKQPKPENPPTF